MKICLQCEGISDTVQDTCTSCGIPLSDTSAVHFPLRRGEADAANPLIGVVVDGKYLVQGVLGKGGMGTVFRAVHQVSLIPVALKILNPRYSARDEYRDYFLAEAQKAGRVTHENAGRILDVGEAEDGTVYIAMEEVAGVTLHDCIHGGSPLPPVVIVEILEQICLALVAAHHAGLVHRDLSPRNVMVMERRGRPFVKILDFGIAKGLPHPAADFELDPRRIPAGFASPPYSAPEHLAGGDVDTRADLYSLGVIGYEALTRRLPVEGRNPQERAEATVRGEILPMAAPPGIPQRLVRLIHRLLATVPEDRPESADAVLEELRAIRQPRSRVLRDVALLTCILAVVVCVMAFARKAEPLLTLRSGALRVAGSVDTVGPVQHLRLSEMSRLRFDFEGFRPDELRAEVVREVDQEQILEAALGAVEIDGALELDASRTAYGRFLSLVQAACQGGPVKITLALHRGLALGVARVLIDDAAPVMALEPVGGAQGVLNADSLLRVTCQEQGRLARVSLEAAIPGRPVLQIPVDPGALQQRPLVLAIPALLGDQQPDALPLDGVLFKLQGWDAAGNESRPVERRFEVDVRVPELDPRTPLPATVVDGSGRLRVTVSQADRRLTIEHRQVGNAAWSRPGDLRDTTIDLVLAAPESLGVGEFEFRLRDGAGNSRSFRRAVKFHSLERAVTLTPDPQLANDLQELGGGLIWTGQPLTFGFTCNSLYRPAKVAVAGASGVTAELLDPGRVGGGRIRLGSATGRDADLVLVLSLEPQTRTLGDTEERWPLRLQAHPVVLELPDTSTARYLLQLRTDPPMLRQRDGTYEQSQHWQLKPPDSRMVRGRIGWVRPGETTGVIELPVRERPDQPLLVGQVPLSGHNEIYLHLSDVFGRPLVVEVGGRPGPVMTEGPWHGAVRVAAFQAHEAVAQIQSDPLRVEFQQPTRVVFHSDYVFQPADRADIALRFQAELLGCQDLQISEAGTDLVFEIPFRRLAHAGGLNEDSEELRREGWKFPPLLLELFTPAGERKFPDVAAHTIRSSLVRERLGRRFPGVPAELAGITMVPVLHALGRFADRVPEPARGAGGFLRRQAIDVKGIGDCYLQERELSRAQYAAIIRTFLALPAEQRPPWQQLVFPGDPAGADRISADGLLPVAYREDRTAYHTALSRGGDLPITGVNFYQAYTVARLAGAVVAGESTCFRLPFGVEMEVATFGKTDVGPWNGLAGRSLVEVRASDAIDQGPGAIHGLDFGAREWVMDLPWPVGESQELRFLVANWLADHGQHQALATGFPTTEGITADLRPTLQNIGVVRGGDLDAASDTTGLLDSRVPGVVRSTHVRRDGTGLEPVDHLLPRIGFRLAGGAAFISRVRQR